MILTLNFNQFVVDFEVLGILKDMDSIKIVPFQKGINYFGYLVNKK